jgi:hypothetical protein
MYNNNKGEQMTKYTYNCKVLSNQENLDVMKKVFLTFKQQSKPTNVCNILFVEKDYKTFLKDVEKDLLTQGVKITMSGIKQADKFFRTNNIKSVNQITKHYKGGK